MTLRAAAFSLALLGASAVLRADLTADQTPFHTFRGLWLDRFDYSTAAQITTAMTRAQAMGITDMIFQVRGQADAYYNSAYEHRMLPTFDPLQVAVTEAHNRGIKLHAWINTMPLWRGLNLPSGSDYLINQHPEYWIRDANNNPQPLNDSYVTVNPTMPEVRAHIQNVVRDIATKYQIDGLHLDYTRMTTNSNGTNIPYPTDPATVARFQVEFPGQTPASNQANYKAWIASQITLTVSDIRDALKTTRPGAQLTAAVWRDADIGLSDYQQDWNTWIDRGLLDAAMPMIYRKGFGSGGANMDIDSGDLYRNNVTEGLDRRGNAGIMSGMGTYMQNNPATAYNNVMAQLNYAKAQGANGIQLYDYGTLYYAGTDVNLRDAQAEVRRALNDFFNANKTAPPITAISNFDSDEGYFPSSITLSGSNSNVAASSTADRDTAEAHSGAGSQKLVINKAASASPFTARHVAGIGTPGDYASNIPFASIGSVGFWLKTSTADLQVSFGVDDATSESTERTFFKNVVPDGQWHKYEWFLNDVGQWDMFSGLNDNGRVASLFATDSIFFTGTAQTNTIFLDDVFYDAAAVAPNQWTLDSNGAWAFAGNWTGPVPNGVGATANLLRRGTAPRTLTLGAATTLGSLTLDNSFTYTIAGPSALTLDVASGSASVNVVNRGSHVISAPIVFNDPTNISVDVGSTLTFSGSLNNSSGRTLTKTGGGEWIISGLQTNGAAAALNVTQGKATLASNPGSAAASRMAINVSDGASLAMNSNQNITGLNLLGNSVATVGAGANKVIKTDNLTLSSLAKFDLNDNDAIVQATSLSRQSVLDQVTAWIASARNNVAGRWRGPGITSSIAAADTRGITGIAAILNDNGAGGMLYTSFDGQSVNINSILIKFTYVGDADLDGDIDAIDYGRIDAGYQGHLAGYRNGDFDFNGRIDADDYFFIDRAFAGQSTPLSSFASFAAVPEPAAAGMLIAATLLLTPRRRR
jgi:uncharacterized lipoprotein YddW (UPF0748 family)